MCSKMLPKYLKAIILLSILCVYGVEIKRTDVRRKGSRVRQDFEFPLYGK